MSVQPGIKSVSAGVKSVQPGIKSVSAGVKSMQPAIKSVSAGVKSVSMGIIPKKKRAGRGRSFKSYSCMRCLI